jgi:hypothetical protein
MLGQSIQPPIDRETLDKGPLRRFFVHLLTFSLSYDTHGQYLQWLCVQNACYRPHPTQHEIVLDEV